MADLIVYLDDPSLDWQYGAAVSVFRQHMTCYADSTAVTGHERHFGVELAKPDTQ